MSWVPDELNEVAGKIAVWTGALFGGAAIGYKAILRMRRDGRDDHADKRKTDGEDQFIAMLQREVARLHDALEKLSDAFNDERQGRRDAERSAIKAEARSVELEQRLERMTAHAAKLEQMIATLGKGDG